MRTREYTRAHTLICKRLAKAIVNILFAPTPLPSPPLSPPFILYFQLACRIYTDEMGLRYEKMAVAGRENAHTTA